MTKDEIADPEKLQVTLSVDGELRVNYNTDDLAHSIAESIEYVAAIEEISPATCSSLAPTTRASARCRTATPSRWASRAWAD